MTAWILEETTLSMFLFFLTANEKAKMQAPVLQRITADLLTNTRTINDAQTLWNTGPNTRPFSAVLLL